MKFRRSHFIIFLFISLGLQSQENTVHNNSFGTRIDSIQEFFRQLEKLLEESTPNDNNKGTTVLPETGTSRDRVGHLLGRYRETIFECAETAQRFNEEAYELATQIDYPQGYLRAKYNKAFLHFVKGNFEESLSQIEELSGIVNSRNYPKIYADNITLASYIHTEKGEYDMAVELGLKLLELGEEREHHYIIMRACSALSHYYLRIENFSKSLNYCLRGLYYIIELKETHYIFPKIDEIARMSAKLNQLQTALDAYSFYQRMENKFGPPGSYIQSVVYMNMANINMSTGNYEKARYHINRSLKMNYEHNYRFRIPRALILQAELQLKMGDPASAISSYEKSITEARHIRAFDVIQSNSLVLARLYERSGQPFQSRKYLALYRSIKDSLYTEEKEQKIHFLETKRRIREVNQELRILQLENEAQQAHFNFLLIILFILLGTASYVVFSYLKIRDKNKILYSSSVELTETQYELKQRLERLKSKKEKEDSQANRSKTLDTDIKQIILEKLDKLEQQEFFLDPHCSLNKVSEILKTNPNYLSQVINQEKKCHFNCYINELRINFLLNRLLRDKEFREKKLSYIASSVGYNNLNTLNSAFKKRKGILPSYFIGELIKKSQKGG